MHRLEGRNPLTRGDARASGDEDRAHLEDGVVPPVCVRIASRAVSRADAPFRRRGDHDVTDSWIGAVVQPVGNALP